MASQPPTPPAWDGLLRRTLVTALLVLLGLAALLSTYVGVVHSVTRSQDFQWSNERILFDHVDPWRNYLDGDPGHRLIGTQVPNYLAVIYVLLAPVCALPMPTANLLWACLNVVFTVVASLLATRFYGLRGWGWGVGVTSAMLASTATRTSISNGQQGLFVLVLWCVAFFAMRGGASELTGPTVRRGSALLLGISYLKYSFAPAVALYLLFRRGMRRGVGPLLWSLAPAAAATVLVWGWIRGPHTLVGLAALATEPLQVARAGYQPTGDLGLNMMDLFEFVITKRLVSTPPVTTALTLLASAITAAVLWAAVRVLKRPGGEVADSVGDSPRADAVSANAGSDWMLALMAALNMALFKHHSYDEVVFLLPGCFALRHWRRPAAWVVLLLIGYHWYAQRFLDWMPFSIVWSGIRFASLLALIMATWAVGRSAPQRVQPA